MGVGVARTSDEASVVGGDGGGGVSQVIGGGCSSLGSGLGTGEDVTVRTPSGYGSVVVGDDCEANAVGSGSG